MPEHLIGWAAAGLILGLWLWVTFGSDPPDDPT